MLGRPLGKVFATASNLILGIAESKTAEKVIGRSMKALGWGVDKGAKVLDEGIKGGTKAVGKAVNKETYKKMGQAVEEGLGKATRTVLTDESSYEQIGRLNGPILKSNKALIADDIHRRIETGLNTIFGVATHKSKFGNKLADAIQSENKLLNIPSKMVRGVSNGLVTGGGDNLLPFGMKATGLGVVAAGAFQVASGTPQAVKDWNKNRMGTNMDSQPVTSAPRVPAYAQDGGATGDLVFALNNLRHGGFM